MAGKIFNNVTSIYEQSIDLFGDDIGIIVESLLLLDGLGFVSNRIYSKAETVQCLTDVERWILSNVGLPEWAAPNLHIQLMYCAKRNLFVLAEVGEYSEIFIQSDGYVVLRENGVDRRINSNCLCFLQAIALYSSFVQQARLVCGSDALVENKIPNYLTDCFLVFLRKIDNDSIDAWLHLIN